VLAAVRAGLDQDLIEAAVDAMNTHESRFFRDGLPFEQLKRPVLPQVLATKPPSEPLRVWSAACAGGQEAYSIAIAAVEHQERLLAGRKVEILATDVSRSILAKAAGGVYSDFEISQGLALERRNRWMRRVGLQWEAAPELKAMVSFRQHNLLETPPSGAGFDIVFCRNVLICFDEADKVKALAAIERVMTPGGFLVLGAAESVSRLSSGFQVMPGEPGLMRLSPAQVARRAG
jgi:chemotaxis protein methyltransferase CheR